MRVPPFGGSLRWAGEVLTMSEDDAERSSAQNGRRRRRVLGGRQHRHVVRVTPEEEGALLARALRYNVSVPKLLVDSALAGGAEAAASNASVRDAVMVELFGLHRLLGALSNNVNQMARVANSTGAVPAEYVSTFAKVRETAERIDELIDELTP
jgi:hypothetical protein